jgi:cyclic beta-1,2-glucan synthetase
MTTDAMVRVFYRKFISRKNLLEWVTAAQSDEADRKDLAGYYRFMFFAPVSAAFIFGVVTYLYPHHLFFAAPFLILWFFSPLIAFWLSRMAVEREPASELDQKDVEWLRLIARRTWRFFETFVGESQHWLPPDNFQQEPTPITAHRTSPTNIGLRLLGNAGNHRAD